MRVGLNYQFHQDAAVSREYRAASVGGLFHFKPSLQCLLLAQSGHSNRADVCPIFLGAKRTKVDFGPRRFVR